MSRNLTANYALVNDIDCTETRTWNGGEGFQPIGACDSSKFTGTLNGNGHNIYNLSMNLSTTHLEMGLIGCSGSGFSFYDLGIVNANMTSLSSYYSGILIGRSWSGGSINRTYTSGYIKGSDSVGGIIGDGGSVNIYDSYSTTDIFNTGSTSEYYIGGLVGWHESSTAKISNSYFAGTVTALNGGDAGGLVGASSGIINNSFSVGNVSSSGNEGGIIGFYDFGLVNNTFWDNHTGVPVKCVGNGVNLAGCFVIQNNKPYFYDISNSPLNSWDFTNIWSSQNNLINYPILKWQEENLTPANIYNFDEVDLSNGNHTWRVTCIDSEGYVGYSETRNLTIDVEKQGNISVLLDGVHANRTYEYGTTANISAITDCDDICFDIYLPNYGKEYTCSYPFNLTLKDFESIINTSEGPNISKEFRITNWTMFYAHLPTYLTIKSAVTTLKGIYNSLHIYGFDDFGTDTSRTYEFVSGVGSVIDMSLRSSKVVTLAEFYVTSSTAYNMSIDICNDGSIDKNVETFFSNPTYISLNTATINACVNTSEDISVVPFNITFTTGGDVTISQVHFRVSTQYYPSNVRIDTGNDGLEDVQISDTLSGTSATITTYTDNSSSNTFYVNTTSRNSTLLYIDIPKAFTTSSFTMLLTSISYNNTFVEDFSTSTHINPTYTTAIRNANWLYYTQPKSGSLYTVGYVNSTIVATTTSQITKATLRASSYLPASTSITYYMSADNGAHWENVTSGTEYTFINPGTQLKWSAKLYSLTGIDTAYLLNVNITGFGDRPKNVSVDLNNNGADYTGTSLVSSPLTLTFNPNNFTSFKNSCADTYCSMPINLSFIGRGGITTTFAYTLSTIGTDLNTDAIITYINNRKTAKTNINQFNDSTTQKTLTNLLNQSVYVNVPKNVLVSLFKLNITGDHYE
jgi:hypothetical protein